VLGLARLADDKRFQSNAARLQNVGELEPLLREVFSTCTMAECQRLLDSVGVPAAPINDLAQVFADPQVVARGMVREVTRPDGQKSRMLASPIRMSRSAIRDHCLPPRLGEHDSEELKAWRISG
ncbi:MAG TPA: CoA transferase, partial [Bordetella sp.]|nr:CoA transferase [Bordetella sp.]